MNKLNGNTADVTEEERTKKRRLKIRSSYWKLEALLWFETEKTSVVSTVVL
jgi:hypothetical protein